MPSTVDLEPAKLAAYMQVVLAQRLRQIGQLTIQLGAESSAVTELKAEHAHLQAVQTQLLKDAANSPLRKVK